MKNLWQTVLAVVVVVAPICAQEAKSAPTEAGYVPILSGGVAYVHNAAGGDAGIYLTNHRFEIGASYQRLLQPPEMNSGAMYISWQPPATPLDIRFEYDRSRNGQGYWLEIALKFRESQAVPVFFKRLQFVTRVQQFDPLNGGGLDRYYRRRKFDRKCSGLYPQRNHGNEDRPAKLSASVHNICFCDRIPACACAL